MSSSLTPPSPMQEVAEFIARVALRKETPKQVAADVTEFRREFSTIHYCFTPDYPAYKFHELVQEGISQ